MTKHEQLVWAAGFFDGEGCISISKPITLGNVRKDGTRAQYPGYQLQVIVAQRIRKPMDMLIKVFGGHLTTHTCKVNNHSGTYWYYRIHGKKAVAVLKQMLPYLVLKKDQARLGIDFQKLVEASRPPRSVKRDPEATALLEQMFQASKFLNKRSSEDIDYTKESGPVILLN